MNKLKVDVPTLVAHRGYSGKVPENTLDAYKAAYKCGAKFMELDLQLTKDKRPVLHHDKTLKRMAGVDIDVRNITVKEFKSYKASYKERFGEEYKENTFTTFKRFCKWLKNHSDVTIFVEIKQESIDRFGIPTFLDAVVKRIKKTNVESQCVIISFNAEVIDYTRQISSIKTGWVLPEWNDENRQELVKLQPEFMFCDKTYLPVKDSDIWQGSWTWAIYNLDDVRSAIDMANRGMSYLETNQIGTLMSDAIFSNE